jgi:hypothetical protein
LFNNTLKLIFINILLISLYLVGFAFGLIGPLYTNDISRISYVITILLSINVILSVYDSYKKDKDTYYNFKKSKVSKYVDFVTDKFPYIGLCGTVIGFIGLVEVAFIINAGNPLDQLGSIITSIKSSLHTLFNTTLLGIGAYLWSSILIFMGEE